MSETQLVKAVLGALRLRRVLAWRVNSGNICVGDYVVRGAPAGSPDIMGILGTTGILFGLELKTETGRQLATQKRWQERAEKHGVRYGVARTIGESLALVDRWSLEART